MVKRPLKIYIGPHGITDNAQLLNKGLREQGVTTRLTEIRLGEDPFFSKKGGYDVYHTTENYTDFMLKRMGEFTHALRKYDVFIFNFCISFLSGLEIEGFNIPSISNVDLSIIKTLGKKVVMVVLGDDLRSRHLLVEECRKEGLIEHARYIEKDLLSVSRDLTKDSIRKAKIVNQYADLIFARPISAQFIKRPYDLIWIGIDLQEISFEMHTNKPPLLLHAPSNRAIKGTKYILSAVEKLKSEGYKFKFKLCENMDNEEVRKLLSGSSIVIDQVILPGYGLFAVEAMSTGNIVLGSAVPGFNGFTDEMPIITTTPSTIYDNLKRVLTHRENWKKIMTDGRKYVEKYHDYRKVSKDMLEKIKNLF